MTSPEFIEKVAVSTGMTKKDVKEMANTFEEELKSSLAAGADFKFAGMTFEVKDVPARKARNPRTGESVDVAAKRKASVKLSSPLKNSVK